MGWGGMEKPSFTANIHNLNNWEAEAEGLRIQRQPELYNNFKTIYVGNVN